ncbi:hypothetical protein [Priestia megaterium]|uniref:hypothetical protein n=1 Tax=Priestia megaterium TaxID=1404 RepID=UPI003DA30EA5
MSETKGERKRPKQVKFRLIEEEFEAMLWRITMTVPAFVKQAPRTLSAINLAVRKLRRNFTKHPQPLRLSRGLPVPLLSHGRGVCKIPAVMLWT